MKLPSLFVAIAFAAAFAIAIVVAFASPPTTSAREGDDPSAGELTAALIAAFDRGDEEAARATFSETAWKLDGAPLLARVEARGLTLGRAGFDLSGKRAVATLEVRRSGRPLEELRAYAEEGAATGWRFVAVDASPLHAAHFLKGDLPARFAVEDLPADATLVTLGEKLLAAAETVRTRRAADPAWAMTPTNLETLCSSFILGESKRLEQMLTHLSSLSATRVGATHWAAALGRGALVIEGTAEVTSATGETSATTDDATYYVAKVGDDTWQLVGMGATPSVEEFLRDD